MHIMKHILCWIYNMVKQYVLKYNTFATNFEHAVIAMHVVPVVERIQYEPWWRDAFVVLC
jgi:hypothetical protein